MRRCGWCLLLGQDRVYDIRRLREHFDTDIMTGYLLGGVLEGWLSDAGETDILARVRSIDRNGDVGAQLEYIFGVRPEKKAKPKLLPHISTKPLTAKEEKAAAPAVCAAPSSFGGSFRLSSLHGLLNAGSFSVSSLNVSSLSVGALSVQMLSGSFYAGSYSIGSLYSGAFGRLFGYNTGSYTFGSLRFGSGIGFGYGYGQGAGSFRSGSGGSFSRVYSGSFSGSFRYYAGSTEITAEEYHRTLINLSSCPLNEYGYGIHLV